MSTWSATGRAAETRGVVVTVAAAGSPMDPFHFALRADRLGLLSSHSLEGGEH